MIMFGERFIEGEPATFFTQSEAAWKMRLEGELQDFPVRPDYGVTLEFVVTAWRRRGHSFDIDNLAKPVFDLLRRPQVEFVEIGMKKGTAPGVRVRVSDQRPPAPQAIRLWMRRLLVGSQKHEGIHPSLRGHLPVASDCPLRVSLLFFEPVLLTDFGFTGSVKPTLDQLWPIIGGTAGRPRDDRIRHLTAQYSDQRMTGVEIGIDELEGSLN